MKKIFIFLYIAFILFSLQAEQANDLSEIIKRSEEKNLEIITLSNQLRKAREDIPRIILIEDSRITLSGNFNYSAEQTEERQSPVIGGVRISVPIISQVKMEGSYNISKQDETINNSGSLSFSISPFDIDTSKYKQEQNYELLLNQLAYKKKQLSFDIEDVLLVWNTEVKQQDYLKENYDLQYEKFKAVQKQYEYNTVDYDTLMTAENNYISTRQDYYEGIKNLAKTKQSLLATLGADVDITSLPQIILSTLQELINQRTDIINMIDEKQARTIRLIQYEIELKTLENELQHTFAFQPSVSIGTSVDFPFSTFNANLSVTFALDQIQSAERMDIKQEIDIKTKEIQAERFSIELQLTMAKQAIQVAGDVWEINQKDVKAAEIKFNEAEFLLSQGERTTLEVKQTELNLILAQIRLYDAAASLYKAQADYLMLF